jgi:hypothetical protein
MNLEEELECVVFWKEIGNVLEIGLDRQKESLEHN